MLGLLCAKTILHPGLLGTRANKIFFQCMFTKVYFLSQTYVICSPRAEIFQRSGTSWLCNLGTCSYTSAPVQPGGDLGDQFPPFEKAQFHKNYLKMIKRQTKTTLKTLNSSVIKPRVANEQRQNFGIF